MSVVKLNDALNMIQRAEESIAANKDGSYGSLLSGIISNFKQKLAQDFCIPVEFFEPVDSDLQEEISAEEQQQAENNPELTEGALTLYSELETSI